MQISKPEFADAVAAIAPTAWAKPDRSGPVSDNCLEVAPFGDMWALRDSTNPHSPILVLNQAEMDAFSGSAADGQYGGKTA